MDLISVNGNYQITRIAKNMEKMIIGKKEYFGFEIKFTNEEKTKGHSCVWVKGHPIGDFSNNEILAPFINPLFRNYKNKLPVLNLSILKSKEEIFKVLSDFSIYQSVFNDVVTSNSSASKSFDSHTAFAGENFDYVFIVEFSYEDNRYFLWSDIKSLSLRPKSFEIFMEEISESEYESVINSLKEYWNSK